MSAHDSATVECCLSRDFSKGSRILLRPSVHANVGAGPDDLAGVPDAAGTDEPSSAANGKLPP